MHSTYFLTKLVFAFIAVFCEEIPQQSDELHCILCEGSYRLPCKMKLAVKLLIFVILKKIKINLAVNQLIFVILKKLIINCIMLAQ